MLQIIPAVDVLDGKVVRLMHGDYDRVTVYGEDPIAQALEWMIQGAELVHVVDLDGARSGDPDRSLWRRLADNGVAFQVGGGIRSSEIAVEALEVGARRVVLGTAAVALIAIMGLSGFRLVRMLRGDSGSRSPGSRRARMKPG